MSRTTAPDEVWDTDTIETQSTLPVISPSVADSIQPPQLDVDKEHVERIKRGAEGVDPDPSARSRMAALLQSVTGWDIFPELSPDRLYVSRLWAEDWNSPEDSVYDE